MSDVLAFTVPKNTQGKAVEFPSEMNQTETRYAEILTSRQNAGLIRSWKYEAVTLKLGPSLRYTPDFFVVTANFDIEFHETKGAFIREDAWQKLKTAAGMFPFRFKLCQWTKEKGWTEKIVGAPVKREPKETVVAPRTRVKSVPAPTPAKPMKSTVQQAGARVPTLNGVPISDAEALRYVRNEK